MRCERVEDVRCCKEYIPIVEREVDEQVVGCIELVCDEEVRC